MEFSVLSAKWEVRSVNVLPSVRFQLHIVKPRMEVRGSRNDFLCCFDYLKISVWLLVNRIASQVDVRLPNLSFVYWG